MDQIEKILNDLYSLDPSLRERGGDIRALVVSLIEAKPPVAIDEAFVKGLRLRLLSLSSPAKPLETHDFSWWAFRLAPLGAIAILILVFLPELTKPTPFASVSAPEVTPTSAPSDEVVVSDVITPEKDERSLKPAVSPPKSEEKLLTMMSASANVINISSKKPGVTVSVDRVELVSSGFVVIRSGNQTGEIIGSSDLIPAGTSGNVPVNLSRSMREGEALYATLHVDDGDESFNSLKDALVLDSVTGEPMYVVFSVTASAPELAPSL